MGRFNVHVVRNAAVMSFVFFSWVLPNVVLADKIRGQSGELRVSIPKNERVAAAMPFETEKGLAELLAGQMETGDRLIVWAVAEQEYLVWQRVEDGRWVCLNENEGVVEGGAARAGQGFFVENRGMTGKTIRLEGELPGEVVVDVRPGLNLVGLAGLGDRTAKEAGLGELLDAGCFLMDAAGSNLTAETVLQVGVGYWLRNPGETVRQWTVGQYAPPSSCGLWRAGGKPVSQCAGGKAVLSGIVPGKEAGKGTKNTQDGQKAVGNVECGARPWVVVQKPRMWRP